MTVISKLFSVILSFIMAFVPVGTAFTKEAEEYDDFNIAPMTQTEAEPEAEQTAPAHL